MASPGGTGSDQADVLRVLHEYYRVFSTLDVEAVLPYFHEPAMLIGPQGVLAAPTHNVLATAVGPGMEALRACGFGRSELIVGNVRSLSATAAMVYGVAQRYKLDGQDLDRAGVTYVLHKANSGWKIAVLILHDPEKASS
jgi:hypothetical protein